MQHQRAEHAAAAPGTEHLSRADIEARRFSVDGSELNRCAIVVSRFNQRITGALFEGAVDVLCANGLSRERIDAVQVPGAVEIPLALQRMLASGRYDAAIALGCVIRGDTSHFNYVCRAVTDGVMRVQLDTGLPVGFGVITCDTAQQAVARAARDVLAGGHNVGADAAFAALEMAALMNQSATGG